MCFTGSHFALAMGLGLTVSLLFGLGVPVGAFWLLWRRRKELDLQYVQDRYGFLYDGFRTQTYYWESVTLLEKLVRRR